MDIIGVAMPEQRQDLFDTASRRVNITLRRVEVRDSSEYSWRAMVLDDINPKTAQTNDSQCTTKMHGSCYEAKI